MYKTKMNSLIIKNERILSQFTMTFFMIDRFIELGDSLMINDNEVFLFNDDMEAKVKIDLLTGEVYIGKFRTPSLNQVSVYNVQTDTVAGGMCNMIVNAMAQWIGGTPYIGTSVCQNLSDEASRELNPYNMSLKLTGNGMKVYKNNRQITYVEAIRELL